MGISLKKKNYRAKKLIGQGKKHIGLGQKNRLEVSVVVGDVNNGWRALQWPCTLTVGW
jgi:hypothetical protein